VEAVHFYMIRHSVDRASKDFGKKWGSKFFLWLPSFRLGQHR